MNFRRLVFVFAISMQAFACDAKNDEGNLDASRHQAALKCERLAACYQATGDGAPVETTCDHPTLHVILNCQNGCITKLWTVHDELLAAGDAIPSACACSSDEDCAPDVRYCDTTSGACIEGPR